MNYVVTQDQIDTLANIAVEMPGRWAIPTSDVIRQILENKSAVRGDNEVPTQGEAMTIPIPGTDVLFHGRRVRFATDHSGERDLLVVQFYSADGQTFQGQPVRFWDADGRVTGDRPGVPVANFITDSNGKLELP